MSLIQSLKGRLTYLVLGTLGAAVVAHELYQVKTARALQEASRAPAAPARSKRISAEGRVVAYPGKDVTVSAEIDGKLEVVAVAEQDRVARGQRIGEIDVAEQSAALKEAAARIREAEAEVQYLEGERRRADELFAKAVLPEAARDKSTHEARLAAARKSSLLAAAARARTVVEKARVLAPISGSVIARHVDEGEMVRAGQPLFTIVDLDALRIEAEVGEFDAGRVALGQKARITAEGAAGVAYEGVVEEIPDVVVPRSLRPLDPASPVDTRVLRVKIKLAGGVPLKLGQRVEVAVAVP